MHGGVKRGEGEDGAVVAAAAAAAPDHAAATMLGIGRRQSSAMVLPSSNGLASLDSIRDVLGEQCRLRLPPSARASMAICSC